MKESPAIDDPAAHDATPLPEGTGTVLPEKAPLQPWAPPWPAARRFLDVVNVLLLSAVAFLIREWRIGLPTTKYFDEIYYVKSATEYLAHAPDSNTVHPPLGKLIIALFMQAYAAVAAPLQQMGLLQGPLESASWRTACLVLGTAMVAITYALAFRLFRNRFVAVVAAFLLTIDFLHVVQSRITMLDMPVAFFILLGSYGAWRYVTATEKPWGWAIFTVTMFAIGTPCKWNSLFAASGATVAMLGLKSWRSRREFVFSMLGVAVLYVIAVPAIYLASFVPLASTQYTWAQFRADPVASVQKTVDQIRANHDLMYKFRYDDKQFTHRYMSKFWQWPTLARPIWYHYEEHVDPGYSVFPRENQSFLGRLVWRGQQPDKYVDGVVAVGSPWVWWTFFLLFILTLMQSVIYPVGLACYGAARLRPSPLDPGAEPPSSRLHALAHRWRLLCDGIHRWRLGPDRPFLFLILLYLPQVILWSVNKGFFFYMLPCVPYMCIFMGAVLQEWLDMKGGRFFIALYLGLALVFFVAYYPLLTAYPLPKGLYNILIPPWAVYWV